MTQYIDTSCDTTFKRLKQWKQKPLRTEGYEA